MTAQEQVEFVNDLVESIRKSVTEAVVDGKTPDDWNGIELRQYLADKFAESNYVKMSRQRKADYENHLAVTSGL